MIRTGLVLAFVTAPLTAQQAPARPVPAPAPVPAITIDPWSVGADARAAAAAARADARNEAMAARADAMSSAIAARVDARALTLDAFPAIAEPRISVNVNPVFTGVGYGAGYGVGYGVDFGGSYNTSPRAPQGWAPQDPADSLYRQAQQAMNRGDYRRAASLFKDIPAKVPNSVYASDALYWEAFSLYRIGGTSELQEALAVLDARKNKYPSGRVRGDRGDADPALATRIAGVLSARGLGDRDLVKRALSEGGNTCDNDDQAVRAEALNALRQTDPDEALTQARKILGRKDECSVQLRRTALWMLANKKDAASTATIVSVARNDPSMDIRAEATGFLGSMGGDEALGALEELVKADDDRVQRAAVRALTTFPNPRARAAMRSLIENNKESEQLRITALDAFDRDRSTLDDATWMRGIYPKVESARIKARIVSAVARIGGDQNEQWLMQLARNEDESTEVRQNALRYVARTADVASLAKFYDGLSARTLREEVINALGNRKEPEATDKLIEIARTGTDPQVRRSAINTLARKNDPRTTKLLLDLISGDAQAKKP